MTTIEPIVIVQLMIIISSETLKGWLSVDDVGDVGSSLVENGEVGKGNVVVSANPSTQKPARISIVVALYTSY